VEPPSPDMWRGPGRCCAGRRGPSWLPSASAFDLALGTLVRSFPVFFPGAGKRVLRSDPEQVSIPSPQTFARMQGMTGGMLDVGGPSPCAAS
jgi:hypothetical protein